jgi:tRNA threonylcarbamoyladenosine biosynthesis protein TsaB
MMSLLLQNSAGQMAVGLGEGDQLIFDSSLDAGLVGLRNVQAHVQAGLDQSGKTMSDVDCVFVDIGPGGLGATRTTVAFANALGFAASIPVIGLHAFELIGRHVSAGGLRPVVCIRPAARPNYYIGKFEAGCCHILPLRMLRRSKSLCGRIEISRILLGNLPSPMMKMRPMRSGRCHRETLHLWTVF